MFYYDTKEVEGKSGDQSWETTVRRRTRSVPHFFFIAPIILLSIWFATARTSFPRPFKRTHQYSHPRTAFTVMSERSRTVIDFVLYNSIAGLAIYSWGKPQSFSSCFKFSHLLFERVMKVTCEVSFEDS